MELINKIWSNRRTRYKNKGDDKWTTEEAWGKARNYYVNMMSSDLYAGQKETQTVSLALTGNLDQADQFYLAIQKKDKEEAANLIIDAWLAGSTRTLFDLAKTPKTINNQVVRPAYNPGNIARDEFSGMQKQRMTILLNYDRDIESRGAVVLRDALFYRKSFWHLEQAYNFLNNEKVKETSGLVQGIVKYYVINFMSGGQIPNGGDLLDNFMALIFENFEGSPLVYDMYNLIQPPTTAKEIFERAKLQYAATQSGALNTVLNAGVDAYGAITGEDYTDVVHESLARLEFIVKQEKITSNELAILMKILDADDVLGLAQVEGQMFKQALDSLRSAQKAVTDAISTALQVVGGILLPGGVIGIVVGAFIDGLVQELLLGGANEIVNSEKVLSLASGLMGHGLTSVADEFAGLITKRLDMKTLEQMGLFKGEFANDLANNVISSSIQTSAKGLGNALVTGEVPAIEDAMVGSLNVVLSSIAGTKASKRKADKLKLDASKAWMMRVQIELEANLIKSLPDTANTILTMDTFNPEDVLLELAKTTQKALMESIKDASREKISPAPEEEELEKKLDRLEIEDQDKAKLMALLTTQEYPKMWKINLKFLLSLALPLQ